MRHDELTPTPPASPSALDAALSRYLEGEPEPGDGELLALALRETPHLVRNLSGMLAIDDLLRQQAEPQASHFVESFRERIKAESSGAAFVSDVKTALTPGLSSHWLSRLKNWLPSLVAVAACVLLILNWQWSGVKTPYTEIGSSPPIPAGQSPDSLALLVNHVEAKFATGAAPDIVSFTKGSYSLLEGSVHIRFRNGTDVVILAPTKFVIHDALHMQIQEGKLRALVPTTGHGFVVAAPGVRFRDLGTEFGVSVSPDGKQSELHVFVGQVEVYKENSAQPNATLNAGESVSIEKGEVRQIDASADAAYPTINSLSVQHWDLWRTRFRMDPNLVFFLPFIPSTSSPSELTDDAAHDVKVVGTIEGARWVTGRWPGKKALQFENAGDGVEINIPGEYEQLTLAGWIKIDRLENAANAILNSVGWRKGNIQWQVDRRASPAITSAYSIPKRTVEWLGSSLPIGRWIHWVVTMDRASGELRHYVNGSLVCIAHVNPSTTTFKPGRCTIGRWISDNKSPENRDFRGRIDEMAMWRIALTPARIAELAEAGMPVELPEASIPSPSDKAK